MRHLLAERAARLLLGLFLYGIGIAMMVRAGIGLAPWDVLTQGISMRTGLSFGLVTVLIGVGVLALWLPLREKFGIGTVLNALLIGPSAELGLWAIPDAHGVLAQSALFGAGLVLLAAATGLYIGARFGSGPRDGLMTGLHARTGWPIWTVRTLVEASVLVTGWWLGGTVGWGTLAFACLVGPLCGIFLPMFAMEGPPQPAACADPGTPAGP
ncbi:MAG: YczE/YyaS/YitT family protein [Luteimonas sp.]